MAERLPTQGGEVRAVFFDIGGTLAYPHPSFAGLIARVCQQHGLEVTAEDAQRVESAVWARIAERDDGGRGFSLSPDRSRAFWLWVYRAFLAELGHAELWDTDLPHRLFEAFTRWDSYRLYEDARPALARLKRAGLVLGVISNWEEWLEGLMVYLDIRRYFDVAVVSALAGVEKPDAEIFRRALEAAAVGAGQAVHVGDNPRDDVEGAQAVGIRGVLVDREGRFAPLIPAGASSISVSPVPPALSLGPSEGEGGPPPFGRVRSLDELPGLLGLP